MPARRTLTIVIAWCLVGCASGGASVAASSAAGAAPVASSGAATTMHAQASVSVTQPGVTVVQANEDRSVRIMRDGVAMVCVDPVEQRGSMGVGWSWRFARERCTNFPLGYRGVVVAPRLTDGPSWYAVFVPEVR